MTSEARYLQWISDAGKEVARARASLDDAMGDLEQQIVAAVTAHPRLPETVIAETAGLSRTTVRRMLGKGR